MNRESRKLNSNMLSIKNDVVFKAVFGRDEEKCKVALKYLLNTILDREDDPIVDVQYKNPFDVRAYIDDKEVILDIKATTDKGEMIDLEMQMLPLDYIENRMVRYHAGMITDSLKIGETYANMKITISIWLLAAEIFKNSDRYRHNFYFMEEEDHFVLNSITHICCIELPKVNKDNRPINELTPMEICLEFIKYANEENDPYVGELIQAGGEELNMAYEMMKNVTEDELLRERALAREKFQRDMLSAIEDSRKVAAEQGRAEGLEQGRAEGLEQGRAEGLEQGRAEGIAEGRMEEKLENAANLKILGISIEQIAKGLGLPIEEVEKL